MSLLRTLLHLLHHLLHLLLELIHHVGVHAAAPTAAAAPFLRRVRLVDPQQSVQLVEHLGGLRVLELELAHELLLFAAGLLLLNYGPNFAEVFDRVHRLQPIRVRQMSQLAVGAEHRLEFRLRLIGQQPRERKRRLHKVVVGKLREFIRFDTRHHSRIDLGHVDHRDRLAVRQHREAARQQVPVEQVASFINRVALLSDEVQVVVGQLLPIEAFLRGLAQPIEHIRPRLSLEIEFDASVFIWLEVLEFVRVRWRLRF